MPQTAVVPDTSPVTVGVRYLTKQPGKIWGNRFFRGAASRNGYAVKLFAANGSLVAAAKTWRDTCFVPCWEQVNFKSPVFLAGNTIYVAAYNAPNGRYAADKYDFTNGRSAGPITFLQPTQVGGMASTLIPQGFLIEHSKAAITMWMSYLHPIARSRGSL